MASITSENPSSRGIAVYCGSSTGLQAAYIAAATSLGRAIATAKRPLVYGGGFSGIMGAVSGAALEAGGKVTGITPYAINQAGGEREKARTGVEVELGQEGREAVETIIVDSMHERKVEMAKRSVGFVGLPGRIWDLRRGIHDKQNEDIIVFVEGPSDTALHETYDWGTATLEALDSWKSGEITPLFDWSTNEGWQGRG
ncbi:putative lysine decarboxylase [Coprinellus micaceus]|uniref:Putative lysine decarboxylase n=1 Tax=Coprinellus micaceus TaxID=71717 RepID=A0A4Y7TPQ6_COPMI|nr:putative lysine decarboxylase [Coprinellus micaceus]